MDRRTGIGSPCSTADSNPDQPSHAQPHQPLRRKNPTMANEPQRDWSHIIVNAAVSAAVGAVVAHLFREHGERGQAERNEAKREREVQRTRFLREQHAQVERLLGSSRARPHPYAPPSPPMMHGLPFAASPQAFPGFPQMPYAGHPMAAHPVPSQFAIQQAPSGFGTMPALPSHSLFDEED